MWNGIGWYGFIGPTTSTPDISLGSDGIYQKFKLIHPSMYVLFTYKNEDGRMKNEGARVITL